MSSVPVGGGSGSGGGASVPRAAAVSGSDAGDTAAGFGVRAGRWALGRFAFGFGLRFGPFSAIDARVYARDPPRGSASSARPHRATLGSGARRKVRVEVDNPSA